MMLHISYIKQILQHLGTNHLFVGKKAYVTCLNIFLPETRFDPGVYISLSQAQKNTNCQYPWLSAHLGSESMWFPHIKKKWSWYGWWFGNLAKQLINPIFTGLHPRWLALGFLLSTVWIGKMFPNHHKLLTKCQGHEKIWIDSFLLFIFPCQLLFPSNKVGE